MSRWLRKNQINAIIHSVRIIQDDRGLIEACRLVKKLINPRSWLINSATSWSAPRIRVNSSIMSWKVFSVKKLGNLDLQLLNLPAVKDIFKQGINPLEIVYLFIYLTTRYSRLYTNFNYILRCKIIFVNFIKINKYILRSLLFLFYI